MADVIRFCQRHTGTTIAAVLLTGTAAVGIVLWQLNVPTTAELLAEAQQALGRANYRDAEQLSLRVLSALPKSAPALRIAGAAAAQLGRPDDALGYYAHVGDENSPDALAVYAAAAELSLDRGRLSTAERYLRLLLRHEPDNLVAIGRLTRLLRIEGRRWESMPYYLELMRQGRYNVEMLILLGGVDVLIAMPEQLQDLSPAATKDPMFTLWQAQQARDDRNFIQAETWLRQVLSTAPDQIEAQAQLGSVLLNTATSGRFLQWQNQLPEGADRHPEIWAVRGIWFHDRHELRVAARCLWEAVRRDPNHRTANYRLSQILVALGQSEQSQPFLDRARKLEALEDVLYELDYDRHDLPRMRRAAELTESLGRLWEASGWCRAALRQDSRLRWARELGIRLQPLLQRHPPLVLATENPASQVDLSLYPLPNRDVVADGPEPKPENLVAEGVVSFVDSAKEAGLNFMYFNSGDPQTGTMKMYEFSGGGIAVLDYDGDGWPDLYLTQGCLWPAGSSQTQSIDRLFRNLGDGSFQDVTADVGLGDDRFSQGATVGDYNNDGFPDLYVANIGGNRFYHNNGDGTFTEITGQTGVGGDGWTTSCLMADLNGDGWPDLYAVNYLTGRDIFSRICRSRLKAGIEGICPPSTFDGRQDRLYLNLGNGRFEEATGSSGITFPGSKGPGGKGLGILAGDFDGSGRLSLFVANDTVANFYFVNQTEPRGGTLRFVERGLETGLGFNREGEAEACMGAAAADVDGDGLLDVFVTNFHEESNTLFLQRPGNYFSDETRQAALQEPSLQFLGFGTQFLDGELDGLPDLVVANGHIDNYAADGQPYQQSPQYFRNLGGGRFQELSAESLGPYFSGAYLGRGLSRLDWNRDGLEDFVVSHLDVPAALLTNRTPRAGHFLAIRLVGVQSDRDAIGTSVIVTTPGRQTQVRQLTAGDGYQASNQRQLVFGLGEQERVQELTVRWTSGLEQTFRNIAADQELLIIENRSAVIRLSVGS